MSASAWWSFAALAITSASAVVSLVKESQERSEKQEKSARRWHWYVRFILTLVGFVAGSILVSLAAGHEKQSETRHSQERDLDKQRIAGLNQAIDTQIHNNETQYLRHQTEIRSLRNEVIELKKDVATQELRNRMAALQTRLDKALAPRPLAKLDGSFWNPGSDEVTREIYAPLDGNVVTIEFSLVNHSEVFAKGVSLWLRICSDCKFHAEPAGSHIVPGAPSYDREFSGIDLPPGIWWQKLTAQVEVPAPPTQQIMIAVKYRCADCLIEDYQPMLINLGRIPPPNFLQPQQKKKRKPG